METYVQRKIIRVTGAEQKTIDDDVAIEKKLRISVNGKPALSLFCSPSQVRELVTGLVATEQVIEGGWCAERMSIEYGDEILVDIPAEGEMTTKGAIRTSGCIGGVSFDRPEAVEPSMAAITIKRETLSDLFRTFQNISKVYRLTGCVHSAALSDGTRILAHSEDIGRHNAVDKVIGFCILENISLDKKILLVSGRLSSEIASKCARWRIPLVASRTAPTSRAIEIAVKAGLTMVGFLREKRFNIYSGPQRIL